MGGLNLRHTFGSLAARTVVFKIISVQHDEPDQSEKRQRSDQLQGDQRWSKVTCECCDHHSRRNCPISRCLHHLWCLLIKYHQVASVRMLEEEKPLKWAFQQDNYPKHTSKRATSWFQTNQNEGYVVSEAKPRNTEGLWKVVTPSWAVIPVYQMLVGRCEALLKHSASTAKC